MIAVVVTNTFFIVDQREQAVVVNLGEPVRIINPPGAYDPGLKVKIPFVEFGGQRWTSATRPSRPARRR